MLSRKASWCLSSTQWRCSQYLLRGGVPLVIRNVPELPSSPLRYASSSASSTRWLARQTNDHFAREAKVQGLKSRAAFKLLQINEKHRLFHPGATVIDLGFAPGSWSQVAAARTSPGGRVIGVDLLPCQPPRGVSTIQGNFLSEAVQKAVRDYVLDPKRGRPRSGTQFRTLAAEADEDEMEEAEDNAQGFEPPSSEVPAYMDLTNRAGPTDVLAEAAAEVSRNDPANKERMSRMARDEAKGRVVDVVLSDMCEPWQQTAGFGARSVSNAYARMMNTSGIPFRDHAGSMDLCSAALNFAYDTLRGGGHLVCKFYQGAEDKMLETKLKRLFERVHRDKPSASRSESREGYFVALRRKEAPSKEDVFAE